MADTHLPASPQPPPAAKRRRGDPRLPLFVAACYPALNKPHGPARWYVRLSRFGAGEQMPLFPAEVGR